MPGVIDQAEFGAARREAAEELTLPPRVLTIVNGDPMESTVSIVVTNATGTTARIGRTVPGRTY